MEKTSHPQPFHLAWLHQLGLHLASPSVLFVYSVVRNALSNNQYIHEPKLDYGTLGKVVSNLQLLRDGEAYTRIQAGNQILIQHLIFENTIIIFVLRRLHKCMAVGRKIVVRTLMVLFVIYIGWGACSFSSKVKVYDEVGLNETQINQLIEFADSIDSFPNEAIVKLRRDAFLRPWTKSELFIHISGDSNEVVVTSGFQSGGFFGAGKTFVARWIEDKWIIEYDEHDEHTLRWIS
ncbi:hypothetical protein [Rubritalea squalenifaciens]|uniref:hypothetical protein n=1 Tax=Rubritalea squalenifaciens TaxID=407226 RepID=UPI00135667AA|nr:hypothetical protein [Rubritalea squalenifaciens]